MRPNSLYISIGVHIALLIAAIVGLPWVARDFEVPQPISVEMVEIAKMTQTTKPAPQSAPKPPEEKKPEDQPPPPKPAPQNTATEPTPPVPKPPEEKKPEEKKPEEKKEKPEVDPNALPDKKQKVEEKKKEEKKPEKKEPPKDPTKDFSSVLKNLATEKKPAATPPTPTPDLKTSDSAPAAAQNAPLGPKMTMSEEDALRHQLEGCWNVPVGAKDAENMNVEIFMVINPDRTLREAKVVDTSRYGRDTFFRAAADSAMRAIRNPLCSPFQLPPDKYDTWKNTTVNFNPSQMF